MTTGDSKHYLVSEYFATGEGITYSILITRGHPEPDDYDESPGWDLQTMQYNPGKLKSSMEDILKREFKGLFGSWYTIGMTIMEKDEFVEKYKALLPKTILDILSGEKTEPFGFHYHSQIHMNYS